MTKKQAVELYIAGRVPEVSDLDGVWQVKMWKWWRFMRKDKKVVRDGKGYNIYYLARCVPVKWGKFTVVKGATCLKLIYENGVVVDHLRLHRHCWSIMLGMFNVENSARLIYNEPFMLRWIGKVPEKALSSISRGHFRERWI